MGLGEDTCMWHCRHVQLNFVADVIGFTSDITERNKDPWKSKWRIPGNQKERVSLQLNLGIYSFGSIPFVYMSNQSLQNTS